jgi:hypothetical protein
VFQSPSDKTGIYQRRNFYVVISASRALHVLQEIKDRFAMRIPFPIPVQVNPADVINHASQLLWEMKATSIYDATIHSPPHASQLLNPSRRPFELTNGPETLAAEPLWTHIFVEMCANISALIRPDTVDICQHDRGVAAPVSEPEERLVRLLKQRFPPQLLSES